MFMKRNRLYYSLFLFLTMGLGLLVRKSSFALPALVNTYAGDLLWALLIFIGFGILFPHYRTKTMMLISISFCYGIELSQLYQADWIQELRQTPLALVLGHGFLWSDLLAYTLGVVLGTFMEKKIDGKY
ncbi:DUF2809 domain-containing protein [Ectobacillus sp. JY-23]|uniref:ribosomal maturation YjgA family protein n=1 Tax=Ectobacillus sp. JY-23 TaxID=2933872 RepID=UPI001FF39DAB|nr:DUF2809 domain-containing protein [Ectobacillus sp. JY-23]UOY94409.1 DUF2809 domain-containing protein [Ectobacillus sp. JY-23]